MNARERVRDVLYKHAMLNGRVAREIEAIVRDVVAAASPTEEEIKDVLLKNLIRVVDGLGSYYTERLVRDLRALWSPAPEWCSHLTQTSDGRWLLHETPGWGTETWKLCPICAAPRPAPRPRREGT